MKTLKWIESAGGPLVVMAESEAVNWKGLGPSTSVPSTTDYDRACDVHDEIGIISLGVALVIVLGDEPDRTAVLPSDDAIFILRWRWALSEQSLLFGLFPEIDRLKFDETEVYSATPGRHLLFDSACDGSEPVDCLSVVLDATQYVIGTALFEPDTSTCVLVHRLRPV